MARTTAVGDGPVVFFSEGVQFEIPLSAIYFDNDAVGTDLGLAGFDKWIKYLASRNRLVAGVAPPVAKAVVATAAVAGVAGNDIQLTVARKSDTTVDLTVTEIDRYAGLTLATLNARIGTATPVVLGTHPGLLRVKSNPLPAAPTPVVNITPAAGGTATNPVWTIAGTPGDAATAVTLEPRRGGTAFNAGDTKTVSISDVPAGGSTFTLTVTWTKKVENVAVAGIPGTLGALGYLVTFTAPDGALAVTKLPRPGTVNLTGGSETVSVPAAQAAVTIMASE